MAASQNIGPPTNLKTIFSAGRDQYNITQVDSLDQSLRKLEPARMDASTRPECLPGTRQDILQFIISWVHLFTEQRVLWLHGVAGSGKSTFSTTVANFFQEQECLGAFVFFDRDVDERSQPSNVVRTLAHQLASFSAYIGTAIAAAIEKTPRIAQSPLRLQFAKLLVKPLSTLPMTETPIVLVFDALDECGNAEDRADLLGLLAAESTQLPSFIRIVITSRAEFDIRAAFVSQPHVLVHGLNLASNDDILSFLSSRMERIRSTNTSLTLAPEWPGDSAMQSLAERAEGLFIWASTACRFIDGHDPQKRLELLLRGDVNGNPGSSLGELYTTALSSAGRWDDEDFRKDFCSIMGAILVAKNPISDVAIDSLLSLDRRSAHTISRLGCVLHWSANEPVRVLHPSFADFLSTRLQYPSATWYIDAPLHNQRLAVRCICYLNTVLKRNICNLTLSPAPVDERLPEAFSYACTSWIDHVCTITDGAEPVVYALEQFLFRHLLHWLEAMSILKRTRTIISSVRRLLEWLPFHQTRVHELVRDTLRFVQAFASSIEEHPLLVYLSALPFTPVHTILYKTFADSDIPSIAGGYNTSWPPLLQIFSGHESSVSCIAFCPDGTRVISSSFDKSIRVWDTTSGAEVLAPLRGHTGYVNSVAVSSSSRRIASGSDDRTIRLWDASTGQEVLPPLLGHTGEVLSVTFSPDGTRIASGSVDQTVRLWDATTGSEVLPPLRGHYDWVRSVEFSPDSRQVVSTSNDRTICLWDIIDGTETLYHLQHSNIKWPLAVSSDAKWIASGSNTLSVWDTGHGFQAVTLHPENQQMFCSVAFFPDGKRVAAISFPDNRICVWDVTSGEKVRASVAQKGMRCIAVGPKGDQFAIGYVDGTVGLWDTTSPGADDAKLVTHPGPIAAMVVSPDGKRIASSSSKDIRVWHTPSGSGTLAALQGHEHQITSLAFSPDSTLLASGSSDSTVRIWNMSSGAVNVSPLRGHERNVMCLAFSSDGRQLASGSDDLTVRLWNVTTGVRIGRPLRGHTQWIASVAFSPHGTRVVSGCAGGSIRMWDIVSRTEIASFSTRYDYNLRSLSFSPDGHYIPAKHGAPMWAWETSETCYPMSPNCVHHSCTIHDPIILTPDGWVVEVATRKIVGKLPSMVSIWVYAASKRSITFATNDRKSTMFTMNFPFTALTSPRTWDLPAYNKKDWDGNMDDCQEDASDAEERDCGDKEDEEEEATVSAEWTIGSSTAAAFCL